ncbi:ATP-binding protein [Actinomadura sp. KC06]|uniref:ATP-binding protein n=1 Tax=Actinomadura sp. KC06 TaxID=2530369 RepID=UPI00104C1E2C|nr:ATP-binding protein [Actinomadura sp. KC06]TDD33732.1 ATP-binding protein [Actinomadura sp. KC06]
MECGPANVLDARFLAARTAPAQVRMLVELRLASWGLTALRDDATLIASELVTNAVRHAPEQEIRVRLTHELRGLLFEVWDASDVMPVRKHDEDGLSGRGLPIVEALALGCGAYQTKPHGKWVWARVGKGV